MENKVESKQTKLFLHTNFTMIIHIMINIFFDLKEKTTILLHG